ncbi:MAG: hypothetical protein M1840_004684 [Geoglossum simile]|nr:MAG: hypothetical protein M1840_004684 [Geoglossum simile]
MLSRKPRTPVVVQADPKRSSSTYNSAPAFLTPPRRPTDSAKSHYPHVQAEFKSQTQYPSYPPRSSPNDPRSYRSADGYDAYQGNQYAMSQSSSRSNSPVSLSGSDQSFTQTSTQTIVRDSHISGGRANGGPQRNNHGYGAVIRKDTVVHNYGAGYYDPHRLPPKHQQGGISYEDPSVHR